MPVGCRLAPASQLANNSNWELIVIVCGAGGRRMVGHNAIPWHFCGLIGNPIPNGLYLRQLSVKRGKLNVGGQFVSAAVSVFEI